jgi:hypothetical protein
MALAVDEVLDDGAVEPSHAMCWRMFYSCAVVNRWLQRALIEKEGLEAGCWKRCDFEKIDWVVVVLQLRKISIGYGWKRCNCWTTPSAVWQTGMGHCCAEC